MSFIVNEPEIEYGFVGKLQDLKYTYRSDIRNRQGLELNFRKKFETLNRVRLSDAEFSRLKEEIITPDVFQASKTLRQRNTFMREDGTPLHYSLVNITDWCKNDYEVINQLRVNTENSSHRYDVILLINGVPVVQIELKNLQVSPRRAMQQIVDYKNEPGNGYSNSLLCFMQLFIVSNYANTYYFTNNRNQHFSFNADEQFLPVYQWAEADNKKIAHLYDFSEKFLAKCTLGEMISRYMVLVESEQKLLVMRPYQIYAVKRIVDCIHQNRGNGYIWHTTGSGKTLTSFKASTLLKDNPDIEKCLFVVDRKDLDRQTREEFNRFQDGCVEENTNTETLVRRMLSEDYADKVIVTTIQKLGLALDPDHKKNFKERLEPLRQKRLVFIFDECHRSQFGDNHDAIVDFFPNAQLFGFTGTPIFEQNASYQKVEGNVASYKTTVDIFQKELHNYTITHAIEDKNVLKFHIDYFKPEGENTAKPGEAIAQQAVAEAILAKHDAATNERRFNAVLATGSINEAIAIYNLFKDLQKQKMAIDDNPPFSLRWDPSDSTSEDFRFKNYGVAPKSAADFSFLLHGLHFLGKKGQLGPDGTMAIILPHGVLFRGGAEERIRKKLLLDGNIDTVIGLPANLFFSTGIPVCIIVLKKCKKFDDVLFINASSEGNYDKGKRQNTLSETHIENIVETYKHRTDRERYSRKVSMDEISRNDYNLNISRYVSTSVEEEKIDLLEVNKKLVDIEKKITDARNTHNQFLKELGLPPI